jgi:hypothetical protein
MKLRSYLIALVVVAVLPVVIFAGVMTFFAYQDQRGDFERGMLDTARTLSLAVDRDLEASIRALRALASSEHLDSGNLRQFYEQARRVLISRTVEHNRSFRFRRAPGHESPAPLRLVPTQIPPR